MSITCIVPGFLPVRVYPHRQGAVCRCAFARMTARPPHRLCAWPLTVLLVVVVLLLLTADVCRGQLGTVQYGGQRLTVAEEQLVFRKVVEEARDRRTQTTDCSVVLVTVSSDDTLEPEDDARRSFLPDSVVSSWPQEVWNIFVATDQCHKLYTCLGVAVFRILPAKFFDDGDQSWEVFRVRYMEKDSPVRTHLHDTEGSFSSGGTWVSSHIWRRTTGYRCPSDHVDASFYYNTWSQLAESILPEPIPSDVEGATDHHNRVGHLLGLWPNANCKRSPVLLQNVNGYCRSLRCPTHTICPAGFRRRDASTLWCTRSDTNEMTFVTGTSYDDSYMASNGGAYVTTPCNNGPASDVGGECGYDLSVLDPGLLKTKCYCNNDVPEGDEACQFVASLYCSSNREGVGGLCANRGVCQLDTASIRWDQPNLGLVPLTEASQFDASSPSPVRCRCDDAGNVQEPWCDRSMCSFLEPDGTEVDCHTDAPAMNSFSDTRGTCEQQGDTFTCVCNDLYFGEGCKWNDNFNIFDGTSLTIDVNASSAYPPGQPRCFTEASEVGISTGRNRFVECSGHGTCTVPRGQDGEYQPENMYCVCANGYDGVRCEFSECPDCGPYGKCVQLTPDETGNGQYITSCLCAVHEDSRSTTLAAQPFGEAACTLDLCTDVSNGRYGTLQMNAATLLGADTSPPTGVCVCEVAGNGLRNTGLLCDEHVCEMDMFGHECGIELPALARQVCKPCSEFPLLLECAQSARPLGAVCDCDAVSATMVSPPEEPYYLMQTRVDRQTRADGERGVTNQPVCTSFCQHGEWREEGEVHKCRGCLDSGFLGERCDEASCLHGTYEPLAFCVPGSCSPGWRGARCNKCDAAFGLDENVDDGCNTCLEGWIHPVHLLPEEFFLLPANETCIPCADASICFSLGTERQVCNHDHAPVKVQCECKAGFTGDMCDECEEGYYRMNGTDVCRRMADIVQCGVGLALPPAVQFDPVFRQGQLMPDETGCFCRPHFSPTFRCVNCEPGYVPVLNTSTTLVDCVPCLHALGCASTSTHSVTCNRMDAAAATTVPDGTCNCFEGYAGSTCSECAPGAVRDPASSRCVSCGLDCGPNGIPDCSQTPPVCTCYNGFSGPGCDVCDRCGVGGTCVSGAFFSGDPWCVCREGEGWRKAPQLSEHDSIAAVCDTCAEGMVNIGGACTDAVELCGFGVHAEASHDAGGCVCAPGFLPMREQVTGMCVECANGGVGPSCAMCDPPCTGNSECTWRNDTVMTGPDCVCRRGYKDSIYDEVRCAQCDFPAFRGDNCEPCPEDCGKGECAVEPITQTTYCRCINGASHAIAGNVTSICSACPKGTTPRTCHPCPACGANSTCRDAEGGGATCECFVGYERAFGHSKDTDPCHSSVVLASFRADPFVQSFTAPPQPAKVASLSSQMNVLDTSTQVVVVVGPMVFIGSMCCAAIAVYRMWVSRKRRRRR